MINKILLKELLKRVKSNFIKDSGILCKLNIRLEWFQATIDLQESDHISINKNGYTDLSTGPNYWNQA